jgi:surfactin synthase thioesterase subunit
MAMLVQLRACASPAARLVCFPPAGARASVFATWRAWLPKSVDLWACETPGRWPSGASLNFAGVIEAIRQALVPVTAIEAAPFGLVGHSFGALLAFEVARALDAAGRSPALLVCGASAAPQTLAWNFGADTLSDAALMSVCAKLFGRIPPRLEALGELERQLLAPLRNDLTLLDRYVYRPAPPLAADIRILAGIHDPSLTKPGLAGWARQTRATWQVIEIEVGHDFAACETPGAQDAMREALEPLLRLCPATLTRGAR